MHDFLAISESQKKEKSEQSSDNRGKVAREISRKLLFAISVTVII